MSDGIRITSNARLGVNTDQTPKVPEETALDRALRYWAADREGVSVLEVSEVRFTFDKGWAGTDVTPGDPPEFVVTYTVTPQPRGEVKRIEIDDQDVGKFIGEIADVASRVHPYDWRSRG